VSHIFISYSHLDEGYAHRLADALKQEGLDVWIDDRVDYGNTWPHDIQENLDKSSAVIILMTPRAYQSGWVQNELSRAQRKKKAIFPLLLEGEPWLPVESIQYVDVINGELPQSDFYRSLERALSRISPTPFAAVVRAHKHLRGWHIQPFKATKRTLIGGLVIVVLVIVAYFQFKQGTNTVNVVSPETIKRNEVSSPSPTQDANKQKTNSTIPIKELDRRLQPSDFKGAKSNDQPRRK